MTDNEEQLGLLCCFCFCVLQDNFTSAGATLITLSSGVYPGALAVLMWCSGVQNAVVQVSSERSEVVLQHRPGEETLI